MFAHWIDYGNLSRGLLQRPRQRFAGRDEERERTPQIVCQRVDFCGAPAERCALMCVEAIAIVPTLPVEPVRT
jgi:hypothetical protein